MTQEFSLVHTYRRPDVRSDGAPPLLLALHGIGSNEKDLIGLQPHLDGRFLVVSARAPYDYAFPGGYSWFGLEIGPQGVKVDLEQAEESRKKLVKFLDEIVAVYRADPGRVYLMGFSQGSIMSFAILSSVPEKLAGVVAMSGRFMPDLFPRQPDEKTLKDFPVMVVHGTHDEVLPVQNARATRDLLSKLPVRLSYKEYPMGHEVSAESIRDVREWLKAELDRK
ncbi:MAG: alpha/beta fold hydrolase [Bdellovibrionota bacterium]